MAARKPSTDNVDRAIRLLTWARAKGFKVGPVIVVGDVTLSVEDVRQPKIEAQLRPDRLDDDGDEFTDEEPVEGTAG